MRTINKGIGEDDVRSARGQVRCGRDPTKSIECGDEFMERCTKGGRRE